MSCLCSSKVCGCFKPDVKNCLKILFLTLNVMHVKVGLVFGFFFLKYKAMQKVQFSNLIKLHIKSSHISTKQQT